MTGVNPRRAAAHQSNPDWQASGLTQQGSSLCSEEKVHLAKDYEHALTVIPPRPATRYRQATCSGPISAPFFSSETDPKASEVEAEDWQLSRQFQSVARQRVEVGSGYPPQLFPTWPRRDCSALTFNQKARCQSGLGSSWLEKVWIRAWLKKALCPGLPGQPIGSVLEKFLELWLLAQYSRLRLASLLSPVMVHQFSYWR